MPETPRDTREVLSRPAAPPDAVLRYGVSADAVTDLRLPVRATDDPPAPLVVLLHGGFWRQEYDRRHTRPMADALAAAGWAVATPEYRRTGVEGGGWPGTLDDVGAALRRLPAAVAEVAGGAVRTDGLVLAGHSAGGHLALWAAAAGAVPGARLTGVLALAPVADLGAAWRLDLDAGAVAALLGGGPEQVPDRYAAADPVRLPPPPVPVVVLHGSDDEQVPPDVSASYAAATGARREVLVGVEHYGLIDPWSAAWPHVTRVLGELAG